MNFPRIDWETLKASELDGKEIFLIVAVKLILKYYGNGIYAV